jgi:hypothetical protein
MGNANACKKYNKQNALSHMLIVRFQREPCGDPTIQLHDAGFPVQKFAKTITYEQYAGALDRTIRAMRDAAPERKERMLKMYRRGFCFMTSFLCLFIPAVLMSVFGGVNDDGTLLGVGIFCAVAWLVSMVLFIVYMSAAGSAEKEWQELSRQAAHELMHGQLARELPGVIMQMQQPSMTTPHEVTVTVTSNPGHAHMPYQSLDMTQMLSNAGVPSGGGGGVGLNVRGGGGGGGGRGIVAIQEGIAPKGKGRYPEPGDGDGGSGGAYPAPTTTMRMPIVEKRGHTPASDDNNYNSSYAPSAPHAYASDDDGDDKAVNVDAPPAYVSDDDDPFDDANDDVVTGKAQLHQAMIRNREL